MPEKGYFCPSCNKSVAEAICPDCGTPAVEIKPKPEASKPIPLPPAAEPSPQEGPPKPAVGSESAAWPGLPHVSDAEAAATEAERPRAAPSVRPASPSPASRPGAPRAESSPAAANRFAGEEELESFIDDGYEVFLVVGIPGAGKTELLASFRQPGFLDRFKKSGGRVLPTSPRTLNCHPIHLGDRKALFVDASGENFRQLYPHMRLTGETTEADVNFLRLIAKGLKGIIAMVELERLWGNIKVEAGDKEQIEILAWILSLVRWLTSGEKYVPGARRFQDQVDSSVMRMRARLKIPVQVLFSKADQLVDFPVPQNLSSAAWLRRGEATARKLYPVGEDPLLIAYHCLPDLYKTVRIHADHFRFDFAHSLTLDPGSGIVKDPNACGIQLALEWLLDSCWQGRWPILPSRYWLDWQQSLDALLGRGRRWQRLLDPVEVQS